MKRFLRFLLLSILTLSGVAAHAAEFQWGTATWNIENGKVYEDINDLKAAGITLTYTNPGRYSLGFFHIISVDYDLFVDDDTTPIKAGASTAPGGLVVDFDYDFVEGHSYRIVTTESRLCQANLATYTTDTLSTNTDSYTISFSIKGPELVKTIETEAYMSLYIVNQEWQLTSSTIDADEICSALGISDVAEAKVFGLNGNGSYNRALTDPSFGYDVFDGWRDADGEYTVYNGNAGGGIYNLLGHNPYPAVYSIKLSEQCDSMFYYFYDYWKEYDPTDPDEVPSSGSGVKRRAPETHYNYVIWDWDNGDGTTTQYRRSYRCDEGSDYKASYAIIANEKMVRIDATMHFISVDDYLKLTGVRSVQQRGAKNAEVYGIDGKRRPAVRRGLNIVRKTDGTTQKVIIK